MDKQNLTPVTEAGCMHEPEPRARWHSPTLTRVAIKRTLHGSGVGSDGTVPDPDNGSYS